MGCPYNRQFCYKKDAGKKQLPTDFVREAENIIDNYMRVLLNAQTLKA